MDSGMGRLGSWHYIRHFLLLWSGKLHNYFYLGNVSPIRKLDIYSNYVSTEFLCFFLFFRYSGVFKLHFFCGTWRISSFDNACAHAALYQPLTNFSRWVPVLLTLLNFHFTHHRKGRSTKPTISTKTNMQGVMIQVFIDHTKHFLSISRLTVFL